MASSEERVSRLEDAQENLATKSDLVDMKTGLKSDIAKAKVEVIIWVAGISIGVAALNSAIALIGLRIMAG